MKNFTDEVADRIERFCGVKVSEYVEGSIEITCKSQIVLIFLSDWLRQTHGSLEVLPKPDHYMANIYATTKKEFSEMLRWLDQVQQDNKCVLKDTKYVILPTDREHVNGIKLFDRKSKNKYAKFIGYLRKKRIIEDEMPMDMILTMHPEDMIDSYFACCESQICSREEITRMIMESEGPERALEMISNLVTEYLKKV
jgi:hypothetical protein